MVKVNIQQALNLGMVLSNGMGIGIEYQWFHLFQASI